MNLAAADQKQLNEEFPDFWKNAHLMPKLECGVRFAGDDETVELVDSTMEEVLSNGTVAYDVINANLFDTKRIPQGVCRNVCNDILVSIGAKPVGPNDTAMREEYSVGGGYYRMALEDHVPDEELFDIWIWMENGASKIKVSITHISPHDNKTIEEVQYPQWELCKHLLNNGIYLFN